MATNATEDYVGEAIPEHGRVIFILVGSVYTVAGTLGNILIIVTVLVTKTMRNPHYYFIVNLAASDLLITGYVIPNLVLSLIFGHYPVTDFNHCVFNGFVIVCAYVSSLLSLMVISINRYLSVCHSHIFSRIFSNKILSSVAGCFIIWLLAFLSTLPCLVGWGRFTYDTKTHYCGYDRTYRFGYTLFLMLFSIGIPVAVVFACNFAMWRFVRLASHRIYAMTQKQNRFQERGVSSDFRDKNGSTQTTSGSKLPDSDVYRNCKANEKGSSMKETGKEPSKEVMSGNGRGKLGPISETCSEIPDVDTSLGSSLNAGCEVSSISDRKNVSKAKRRSADVEWDGKTMKNKDTPCLRPHHGQTSHLIGLAVEQEVEKKPFLNGGKQQQGPGFLVEGMSEDSGKSKRLELNQKTRPTKCKADIRRSLEPAKNSGVLVTPDELALIKTIFIIFISFAILMTPYMMSTLLDTNDQWSAVTHLSCSFTSFTNSCLNCLLYGIMTPAFKKAYRKLFTRCCAHASTMKVTTTFGRAGAITGVSTKPNKAKSTVRASHSVASHSKETSTQTSAPTTTITVVGSGDSLSGNSQAIIQKETS